MRCIFLISLCVFSINLMAFNPRLNWHTLTTPHFKVHFPKENKDTAYLVADIAEKVHQHVSNILDWKPKRLVDIVVTDHTDFANGYATPLPYNKMVIFIQPVKAGEMDFKHWLELLITHEYAHILHLDKSKSVPLKLRNIFGRMPLAFPNTNQPSWLIEGVATYLETSEEALVGRGQSTLFKMMMQTELRFGFKSLAELNTLADSWPLNARYLYGYYFFRFLEDEYGKETMLEFIEAYSDNWFPYLLNTNAKEVTDKELSQLWKDFESYLHDTFQTKKYDNEKNDSGVQLTHSGFFKRELEVADSKQLFYVKSDGFHQTALIQRQLDGTEVVLTHLTHPEATLDWDQRHGLLITQPEFCDKYRRYYDIYHFDITQNRLKKITHCGRYLEAQWLPNTDEMIAIQSNQGLLSLVRLNLKGHLIEKLWQGQEGDIVSYIDISSNGQYLVASVKKTSHTRANLALFDLNQKQWFAFPQVNANQLYAKFSFNGEQLRFIADFDQFYHLYEMDLKSHTYWKVTNTPQGISESTFNHEGIDYYLAYTHRGYDLFAVSEFNKKPFDITPYKYHGHSAPEDKVDHIQNTASVLLSKQGYVSEKKYSVLETLKPTWWLPVIEVNDEQFLVGAQTSGEDALEVHQYSLSTALDFERQFLDFSLIYDYDQQWRFRFFQSHSIFNSDNDVDRFQRQQNFDLSFHLSQLQFGQRWDFQLGTVLSKDVFGTWQSSIGSQPFRQVKDMYGAFIATYDSGKNFLRSISPSDGRSIRAVLASRDVFDSNFTGETLLLDWREYFQLHKAHTLSMRFILGRSDDTARPFILGGVRDESFFFNTQPILDRRYSFRGFSDTLPQLIKFNMNLISTEYRFPIHYIERSLMAPPIGFEKISGLLFFDTAKAYNDNDRQQPYYESIGFELHAKTKLFYELSFNARMGYAKGLGELGDDEFYFNVGSSF